MSLIVTQTLGSSPSSMMMCEQERAEYAECKRNNSINEMFRFEEAKRKSILTILYKNLCTISV